MNRRRPESQGNNSSPLAVGRRLKLTFHITEPQGERIITLQGQYARTLDALVKAGTKGVAFKISQIDDVILGFTNAKAQARDNGWL